MLVFVSPVLPLPVSIVKILLLQPFSYNLALLWKRFPYEFNAITQLTY